MSELPARDASSVSTMSVSSPPGGSPPDWDALISSTASLVAPPIEAWDITERRASASRPCFVRCEDSENYVVKFLNNPYGNGRAIFLEQVVPLLGQHIAAPVPVVERIDFDQELISAANLTIDGNPPPAGEHHGSLRRLNFSDRHGVENTAQNVAGHAALSVLYTWLHCVDDHQLIYGNSPPYPVLSVDHSAFFAKQGKWDPTTLQQIPPPKEFDPFFDAAHISDDDRAQSLDLLAAVSAQDIALAVATPPASWGVADAERVALAETIYERQELVLAMTGRVRQT